MHMGRVLKAHQSIMHREIRVLSPLDGVPRVETECGQVVAMWHATQIDNRVTCGACIEESLEGDTEVESVEFGGEGGVE